MPSGAWFEAAWNGTAEFPPQDEFCPLASAAKVYGFAAAGKITIRRMQRLLGLLEHGIDPVQAAAPWSVRMLFSQCSTSYGSGGYEGTTPLPDTAHRRLMPRESIADEDALDRMTSMTAYFFEGIPSPSAAAINRLGFTRGKDQTRIEREKKQKRGAYRKKVEAIKAASQITDASERQRKLDALRTEYADVTLDDGVDG